MNNIVKINVENIYPHPDNPRKDLGDLEEMVKSIEKNGIMQNLTVISVDSLSKEPDEQAPVSKISLKSDFYVLIGHRRLAAAKKAGLKEVPCQIVSNLSKKEQISIMLEENMQRNDLTVYEQAQGFQMMLDLGDTVEDIVEKTGFSQATVYHRINLAKLDQELLKEKNNDEGFQMSLKDMYLLEKIEDVDKRNEVLRQCKSSSEMNWKVNNALAEVKRKKYLSEVKGALEKAGIPNKEENYTYKFDYVYSINVYSNLSIEEFIKKVVEYDGENKFYTADDYGVRVYADKKIVAAEDESEGLTKEATEEDIAQAKREAEIEGLGNICEAAFEEMKFFIRSLVDGDIDEPKETDEITKKLWEHLIDEDVIDDYDGLVRSYTGDTPYRMDKEDKEEAVNNIKNAPVYMQMLLMLIDELNLDVVDYYGAYDDFYGKSIRRLYDELKDLHFSFSKEEYEKVILGTHELYQEGEDD